MMAPILHVTHKRADADSLAGVIWGVEIFGGCSLVHEPNRVAINLMREIDFKPRICWDFKRVFAYDVDRPERLPMDFENLVVFDHHPRNSFRNVELHWQPRASLAMNLYDISIEAGYELTAKILFSFAVALVTDTALLRTASSEEMYYLSLFLNGRRMEEVYEVVFRDAVRMEDFVGDLSTIESEKGVCWGRFSSDDHFTFFVDTFMYALGCSVVVGERDWGVWVYAKKRRVQEAFRILKKLESVYDRKGGKLIGARLDEILSYLLDSLGE